jgi:hypothetical protein
MSQAPKQGPCGCGAKSVMCVHGADGAWWMCRACYERLLGILRQRPAGGT